MVQNTWIIFHRLRRLFCRFKQAREFGIRKFIIGGGANASLKETHVFAPRESDGLAKYNSKTKKQQSVSLRCYKGF